MNFIEKLEKELIRPASVDLEYWNYLTNQINEIKNKLNSNESIENKKINLNFKDLNNINFLFDLNIDIIDDRKIIKEILNNVKFNSDKEFPVVFMYNLLVIDEDMVLDYLNKPLDKTSLRELTQTLTLIEFNKRKSLKEIAKIGNLPFDYTKSFDNVCLLENKILKKIEKTIDFADLISYLGAIDSDFYFKKGLESFQEDVVKYLEEVLLEHPESDNLIEFHNDMIGFNHLSLEKYGSTLDEDKKRELIQSLLLILNKSSKNVKPYSQSLFSYKGKIIDLLRCNVTEEDINSAIEKFPKKITDFNLNQINKILRTSYLDSVLNFDDGEINNNNIDKLFFKKNKNEQILLYFIIQCEKENNTSYKLVNNKNIKFSEFKELFYLEELLKKELSKYTLNEMLITIHEFKKDKVFNEKDSIIIDKVIIEKFVSKFSYNTVNKELLFINENQCVFNENIISKINELDKQSLLEIFIFSSEKIIKELSENILINKEIYNIKNYENKILDKIKYIITEKEILDCIENIEEKSNTLIKSKEYIFNEISIKLNAKETKEINNDITIFEYKDKNLKICSFNIINCKKLLQKDISEITKREFVQSLFILELQNNEETFLNKDGNKVKIHDNFKNINDYEKLMYEKIKDKIKEDEFDAALNILLGINEDNIENLKKTINKTKKKIGIKVKSSLKNIF